MSKTCVHIKGVLCNCSCPACRFRNKDIQRERVIKCIKLMAGK